MKRNLWLKTILEKSLEGILLEDSDSKILYQNPGLEKMTGFSLEERLEKTSKDFIHPEDLEKFESSYQLLLLNPGFQIPVKYRLLHKAGHYIHVEGIATNLLHDSNVEAIITTLSNITKLAELEATLEKTIAKQSEHELWYSTIIENGFEGIYALDNDLNLIYQNHILEQILGARLNESNENKNYLEIHPDDIAKWENNFLLLQKMPGVRIPQTLRVKHQDGNFLTLEIISVNQLGNEKIKAIVCSIRDVTEKTNLTEKINEQQLEITRQNLLIQTYPGIKNQGLTYLDKNFCITNQNSNLEEKTSFTLEEIQDKKYSDFIHPDDNEMMKKTVEILRLNPRVQIPVSYRLLHKDGHFISVEGVMVNLLNDENTKSIIVNIKPVAEVSETINKDLALSEVGKKLPQVIEAAGMVLMDIDYESEKITFSENAEKYFGVSKNDLTDINSTLRCIHPDDRKNVIDALNKGKTEGELEKLQFRTINEGKVYWLEPRSYFVYNRQKKVIGSKGVLLDITDLKEAEEALKMSREKIVRSVIEGGDAERKKISEELHDSLGQNLAAAQLNFESASNNIKKTKCTDVNCSFDQQKNWSKIETGMNLVAKVIEEICVLSQELMPKAIEDFGLTASLSALINSYKMSSNTEINFIQNIEKERFDHSLELNLYRISQEALNNIMRHAKAEQATLQIIKHPNELILSIEDNGIGIDQKVLHSYHSGLGLKNIMSRTDSLNGSMQIESTPEQGTNIVIQIPLKNKSK